MQSFGFIITRHVRDEKTNLYWNLNVSLLRKLYPMRIIVIIDDNSDYKYVHHLSFNESILSARMDASNDINNLNNATNVSATNVDATKYCKILPKNHHKNLLVIQSEYPGRGELLPFIYYAQHGHKWFKNAVIIHDSTFFHTRIPFEKCNHPVMPLWHHLYDGENSYNLLRITQQLTNNYKVFEYINAHINTNNSMIDKLKVNANANNKNTVLCFGCQCYINLSLLQHIYHKYTLFNLINVIRTRIDRCSLERILGILFSIEYLNYIRKKSFLGDIMASPKAFQYTFDHYMEDIRLHKKLLPISKVWSGR